MHHLQNSIGYLVYIASFITFLSINYWIHLYIQVSTDVIKIESTQSKGILKSGTTREEKIVQYPYLVRKWFISPAIWETYVAGFKKNL